MWRASSYSDEDGDDDDDDGGGSGDENDNDNDGRLMMIHQSYLVDVHWSSKHRR